MNGVDFFVKYINESDLPYLPPEIRYYIRNLSCSVPVRLNITICECVRPKTCGCEPTYSLFLDALKKVNL